jgi:hypothetical protein
MGIFLRAIHLHLRGIRDLHCGVESGYWDNFP